MSPITIERSVIERRRPGQDQKRPQGALARERAWERAPSPVRLTATELSEAIYRPRQKIHRDFSAELARAGRWFSRQTVAAFRFRHDPTPHE